MKIIKILIKEFNPVEIYESEEYITLIINDETNIAEKLKQFPKKYEVEKSLRILTTEELEKISEKLGVKVY
ncbi:hypothetical protein BG95_00775 [Thermosipho sp. 1063]|uniref:hypothetical protein n=1 Tax=unclassified Thermosipho (in: thermotogales) TaxID=2676525 RepID=UPI0009493D53|nr:MULTISPECIES: hypothetical protein [unclassified Thermosipho (in: thermotogales)]ANQ53072.1 hypothetical protein Y592_00780 [Thermosipho sp. 1070]APT71521.1 hypothetical protein BG95_00775 [Thermosipho sp. 1063]OOC45597.1 hypothetical protein XO08_00780 [Thermosipho sp. 1074]